MYGKASTDFVTRSQSLDTNKYADISTKLSTKTVFCSSPYEIRFYNDQLLQLERAFLNPLGQGGDYSDLK